MSISTINNHVHCIHSNHLFARPLCENQSLVKRVANIAFHVLTAGIPYAIYRSIPFAKSFINSLAKMNTLSTHKPPIVFNPYRHYLLPTYNPFSLQSFVQMTMMQKACQQFQESIKNRPACTIPFKFPFKFFS